MSKDLLDGRLFRLIRKELSSVLRDRRTIITLILMPLLLYPLLIIAFQQFFLASGQSADEGPPKYVVVTKTKEELQILTEIVQRGTLIRDMLANEAQADTDLRALGTLSSPRNPIAEPLSALKNGDVDLVVEIRDAKKIVESPREQHSTFCTISYLDGSETGRLARDLLEDLIAHSNNDFLHIRVGREKALKLDRPSFLDRLPDRTPNRQAAAVLLSPWEKKVEPEKEISSFGVLTSLIPLVLILMTITGAVYPAIDLTAGERERGTLEILVAAPIPRMGLLIAKYVSVLTVAVLTALINLVGMMTSLWVSGLGQSILGDSNLSLLAIVQVFFLLLLFAAFFSAVLLAVTSFARSFKEAQVYLIPLMLMALTPGMASLLPGIELKGFLQIVPLLNIVLLTKSLLGSGAPLDATLIVVVSTALYALVAISIAARIFGAEAVLYSEQSGWGDLFRRPAKATPQPKASTAMLTMGLLFPCIFVVTNLLAKWKDAPEELSLVVVPLLSGALFVLLPLLVCFWGRHNPALAFLLKPRSYRFWISAIVLGASLWCFAAEIGYLMREMGISGLPEELLARQRERYESLRRFSPILIILALGAIPAAVEELFFRGFLFRALAQVATPRTTIVTTAFLFASLHVVMGSVLAVERFPSSFLMGLVLGYLTRRAGSVWPALLLHVCFNTALHLVGYYEPQLVAEGWLAKEQAHLPALWLIVAGIVALMGLLSLFFIRPSEEDFSFELASVAKAN